MVSSRSRQRLIYFTVSLEFVGHHRKIYSRNYFRNGITARDNSLYLACTHIYKRDKSFFPNLLGDIRETDQKWSGLLLIGINKWDFGYQVDSYILRADLKKKEKKLKFTDEIPLPKKGKCFANGLVSDGEALYVANSFGTSIHQNTFFKVLLSNGDMTEIVPIIFSPTNYDQPNGLKFSDGYLYYTCWQKFPVMTASLKRIKINENNVGIGKGEVKAEAEVIYQSPFSFFDDFDIVDNGFIIADIVDIPHSSGCLRFVSKDDRKLTGIFRHKNLIKPSSVKVVNDTKLFEAGDILITEKGLHCVSWLRPDKEWRKWLVGSSA